VTAFDIHQEALPSDLAVLTGGIVGHLVEAAVTS
jgi:hypothetical protein